MDKTEPSKWYVSISGSDYLGYCWSVIWREGSEDHGRCLRYEDARSAIGRALKEGEKPL